MMSDVLDYATNSAHATQPHPSTVTGQGPAQAVAVRENERTADLSYHDKPMPIRFISQAHVIYAALFPSPLPHRLAHRAVKHYSKPQARVHFPFPHFSTAPPNRLAGAPPGRASTHIHSRNPPSPRSSTTHPTGQGWCAASHAFIHTHSPFLDHTPQAEAGAPQPEGTTMQRFPVVHLLASLLESLNPELPFDASDPKGDEYLSRWHSSPTQHATELLVSFFLFGPLLFVAWRNMQKQMRALRITYTPTKGQVLWSFGLLMTLLLQVPLKLDVNNISSHPAYFLQPCHVTTILYFICTVAPSDASFICFHALSLLTWGPSLAFCFPNLPATRLEVLFFHLQHIFLVTAPLFAVNKTHRPLYRSWSWNYFSFVVLSAYHWWLLLPWAIKSGINVATMTSPPPALVPFGRCYRLVQGLACLVLHTMSIGVHLALSALMQRMAKRKRT